MLAFEHCMKGEDMEHLIDVWAGKRFAGRKRDQIKHFGVSKLNEYLETTRNYTVLNDDLIPDEAQYRNHVANMQYTDEALKT